MTVALASTPLQHATTHLEFLGYRAQPDDSGVNFKHDVKPFLRIYGRGGSLIFLVPFGVGSRALADPAGFVEFLNRVNIQTILCKFYVNGQTLFVQSNYAGPYEKASFGSFFDAFMQEIWAPRELFPEDVKKFLT
jgi:hypothetical protein